MNTGTVKMTLSFEQVLELVRQLSGKEKVLLSRELAREVADNKLSLLLDSFKTNELDPAIINAEVEAVRAELYASGKGN